MNYRSQPTEQTGFSDCGYFESSPSTAFTSSAAATAPQLLIDTQLAQPSLSSDALPQPSSSSSRPDPSRPAQACGDYHTSSTISGAMPYGHQSYADPPVSVAFTSSIEQLASSSIPFFYPCHKLGYYTSTPVTPTVITHTASTAGAQGSVQQAHSYPHTGDAFPLTPCGSISYPAVPVHAALPSVTAAHCFSVPEQVAVTGVRGKHKQKTGGARTVGPSAASLSTAPTPTSCLAKLLSCSAGERKPSLGFDAPLVTAKGQRSSSPSSSSSGGGGSGVRVGAASLQLQHEAGWPAGVPVLTPVHSQSASLSHSGPLAGTSRGSAVSALLGHGATQPGATQPGATLLIPKTEKLSPVQLYGTDRSSLTVNFSGRPGQTSPPNPESPHSCFSGHGKIESSKQTETRRITHISAEQKRRFNIKLGFDTLHNLVTTLSSQPSVKVPKTDEQLTEDQQSHHAAEDGRVHQQDAAGASGAARRGAETPRGDPAAQHGHQDIIGQPRTSVRSACQQQLPATGVPITRQRFDHMRQKFREYVQAQTLQNWKFWIFSIIIEPLFESYNGMVSTASVEDLCRSTLSWLDQHCSLPTLRPMVLSSLRLLSTTTAILTDPSLLPEQATLAVTQGDPAAAALHHSLQPATRDNVHPM